MIEVHQLETALASRRPALHTQRRGADKGREEYSKETSNHSTTHAVTEELRPAEEDWTSESRPCIQHILWYRHDIAVLQQQFAWGIRSPAVARVARLI